MSQDLLHAVVDGARRTFRAQACSILLHDPGSHSLVFAAMSGEGAESIGASESLIGVGIPDSTGVAGWVLATGEPLLLDDVAHDRRFAEDIAETIGYVPRRLLAMPLLLEERVLGVLEVLDAPAQTTFTEIDQLRDFAADAVLALTRLGLAK
jgi:GAF domain-containing protein